MTARKLRIAGCVGAVVIVLDHLTKAIVERSMTLYETIPLLPFFSLTYVRNTGAAFGILSDLPTGLRIPLFLGVTVLAVAALVSYLRDARAEDTWMVAALGGILGGAAGNFVDRVRYGEVVDFLHLHYGGFDWPMFNVADSAITVGVAIVLLHSLRAQPDGKAAAATEAR